MNPVKSPETRSVVAAAATASNADALAHGLRRVHDALLDLRRSDGHWCFPLEADCTIPAEYVLMMHFLDEIDADLQRKLASYVRDHQADHGGWPLYHGGSFDISGSVKAYWALKLAGDAIDAPHMVRAREAILQAGGAARANVFTRFALAMFGQVPWRAVPYLPAELVLLPAWSPFHFAKVSYWSRAVAIPLSILYTLRARAKNPTGIGVPELFTVPPDRERNYFPVRSRLNKVFLALERHARRLEPLIPRALRRRALKVAERWVVERLNGVHGLGGVFPSMVNALEAMIALGYPKHDPRCEQAREALRRLLVVGETSAYCQPCVSPIWDTAIAALALHEARGAMHSPRAQRAVLEAGDWLRERQQLDGPADWRTSRPDLAPGGWPFQYANDYFPDLDDASAVVWALRCADPNRFAESIRRGLDWIAGMQSANGGFGAFDVDNTQDYLLEIPFADHGALLDPPTADVSARCLTVMALSGRVSDTAALRRCLDFLLRAQEPEGCWFGRWGTNYIYGTWCVLAALEHVSDPRVEPARRRAVAWLKSAQRRDGGWGESNDSYEHRELAGRGQDATSYQTAWALLALMAAGEAGSPEVARGVAHLLRTQREDGLWRDPWYTAPGFPRVFYLRYHGYSAYFPLWALARFARAHARMSG